MRCIVCGKRYAKNGNDELCHTCENIIDIWYKNRPEDKELTLNFFRKESSKKYKGDKK